MAANYHPTLSDPAVQENLHLFQLTDMAPTPNLCSMDLFNRYLCSNCPFGRGVSSCTLYFKNNPRLPLFIKELELVHPELFI